MGVAYIGPRCGVHPFTIPGLHAVGQRCVHWLGCSHIKGVRHIPGPWGLSVGEVLRTPLSLESPHVTRRTHTQAMKIHRFWEHLRTEVVPEFFRQTYNTFCPLDGARPTLETSHTRCYRFLWIGALRCSRAPPFTIPGLHAVGRRYNWPSRQYTTYSRTFEMIYLDWKRMKCVYMCKYSTYKAGLYGSQQTTRGRGVTTRHLVRLQG